MYETFFFYHCFHFFLSIIIFMFYIVIFIVVIFFEQQNFEVDPVLNLKSYLEQQNNLKKLQMKKNVYIVVKKLVNLVSGMYIVMLIYTVHISELS